MEPNIVWLGFVASLLAGLCSGVGALAVFVVRRISDRTEDLLLSVAAGFMLAASLFSLILPGIEYAEAQVAFLTGLVEPVGGLFGAGVVSLVQPLMPWTLGFAARAMLFIISDEIIPETHRGGYQNLATFSLLGGFGLMMFLDATLG